MLFDGNISTDCPIRQRIRDFYHIDENEAVNAILPIAEVNVGARSRAWDRARNMVLRIRRDQERHGGVDALLNEYSLSSEEGVVLMCLAEALLRVPDKHTQDELIRDKLNQGNWQTHLGNSDSLFVNASSWGLLLTGNMVKYADVRQSQHFGVLKKTLGKVGEPVIRRAMNLAMKIMGRQFVMGETIEAAVDRAKTKEQQGYVYSYDMLGEGARTQADADRYFRAYEMAIEVIGKAAAGRGPRKSPGISVKLSAIHPRYEFTNKARVMEELPPRLKKLCLMAKQYDIGLTVDAEEADRLDLSLDIIEAVYLDHDLGNWDGFGLAVQAYQKRAIHVIDWLRDMTQKRQRKLMVRLVKGAYWDTEIKQAQKEGLAHFPVFTRKSSTDVSYHACANRLLACRDTIFPQFATHNAYSAAVILELAGDDRDGFEFQCLHGMGDSLYDQIVTEEGIQCRVYAPVGQHEDLLAYLVRRLLENGANSSFVNAIVDDTKPVEALLEDPVEKTQRLKQKYNQQIQLPIALYGDERPNSKGVNLSDINEVQSLKEGIDRWWLQHNRAISSLEQMAVVNPANTHECVGSLEYDSPTIMLEKLTRASDAFFSWSSTPVKERSELLRRIADIHERHMEELIGLCIKEAGKVTQDGIDEVREAVDFCRYYAAQAESLCTDERLTSRGVVLCISPWNFPLAIFLGQVVAAVVTGNTVLAKPAEQTSLIALRSIELMRSVGLPEGVVQPIVSPGQPVGETLLSDTRIKAVMFTGSTQTGALIAQSLAARGDEQVPLIAETGGQNCMIVDSTALPEQVVDDVVASGFQSAGQRCSALRVLFLQEDIAEQVIAMLKGAMAELQVGDPSLLATDIGPVIDEKALTSLRAHRVAMETKARVLYETPLPASCQDGTFFPPTLYEIPELSFLHREIFGPCVHVVRFKGEELETVVQQINSTGFGLTMGIHSRLEERSADIARRINAGNIYINRNMIGAIVGVQPFGGRGLSGTGPKAGGPNYLARLMIEANTPDQTKADHALAFSELQSNADASDATAKAMERARAVDQQWRLADANTRLSYMRQLLAKLAEVEIIDELAEDLTRTLALCREQLITIEALLREPKTLPGPTGESNVLYLEPRGTLLCFADQEVSFEYWALSLVTALATGNTVVTVVSDLFYAEAQAFVDKLDGTGAPKHILQVARLNQVDALLAHPNLSGVAIDSRSGKSAYMSQQLAARDGAILPVITAEHNDNLVQRLLVEKAISVDTTASGGNTALMTLTEEVS